MKTIFRYVLVVLIMITVTPVYAVKMFASSRQGATSTNEVYRYVSSGPTNFPSSPERIITDPRFNQPLGPYGLVISPWDELFVLITSLEGTVPRLLDASTVPIPNGTIISPVYGRLNIGAFRNNELFVVNSSSGVLRFLISGTEPAVFNGEITGFVETAPRGLTFNPTTGELFVTQCCRESNIRRFTFDNSGQAIPHGTITGGGLNNPHDLAFSPWGELFVANANGNSVSRFVEGPGGNFVPNGEISGNGLNTPIGLAFSPWGELFVGNADHEAAKYISRWTFNESHTAIPNGTLATPQSVGDIEFGGFQFATFTPRASVKLGPKSNDDSFKISAKFGLGAENNGIDPVAEDVTIKFGSFSTTIPAGKFQQQGLGLFTFKGTINKVDLKVQIHEPQSSSG